MTAQFGDIYHFRDNDYTFVAQNAPMPFHPVDYGITPAPACTACWQGFWCEYDITEDGIFLETLYVNSKNNIYPAINGILPDRQTDGAPFSYMEHHRYSGLHIKIPYTGRILMGDDFLSDYYIHMGFQQPWAYQKLIDLVFENGKLIKTLDQSHIAEGLRIKLRTDEAFGKRSFLQRLQAYRSDRLKKPADLWWL